jgi:hypothetical protein
MNYSNKFHKDDSEICSVADGSNMHHLRRGGRRDVRDTLTFEWIIFDFGKAFGKMGTQPFSLSAFAAGLF